MIRKKPSISIFFPFLNDLGTVGSLVGLSIATVEKLTDDWEMVIVNDGSREEDREALEMIINVILSTFDKLSVNSAKNPIAKSKSIGDPSSVSRRTQDDKKRIRIIHHEKNRGYGGALRSGFEAAKKDLIFYTDCDAQYDPRELVKLYHALKPGVDMVNGYKIKRNDPWIRVVAGRIYHYAVKFAFNLPIRDTDCDFRLIRRKVFDPSIRASSEPQPNSLGRTVVRLFENTGTICVELVKKIDYYGYKITEVPVHHFWRTSGKSQFFNFGRLYKTGVNLLRLWWKLIVKKEYYS